VRLVVVLGGLVVMGLGAGMLGGGLMPLTGRLVIAGARGRDRPGTWRGPLFTLLG
jgi:hypothetical protein